MASAAMTPEQRELLHSLAYLYLRHGQNRRALTLILLATKAAPDQPDLLRTLAYAFLVNDAAPRALEVLDQIERLEPQAAADRRHLLLRCRALLRAGRAPEAKRRFGDYLAARRLALAA